MRILFAIITIFIGLSLVFGGYRLARFLIPFAGFLAGLSFGAAIVADLSGEVFLGTAFGIIVGLIAGLFLAVIAYLYYNIAVIVLAGTLGYMIGSEFIMFLGLDPGIISVVTGLAVGIFIGLVALMANAPKYVLIILTALTGSVLTIGGMLLMFNQIPLEAFSYTAAKVTISDSLFWSVGAIALLSVGIISQANTGRDYTFEEWSIYDDSTDHPTHQAPPTATPTV